MITSSVYSQQSRNKIGITKAAASVEKNCIEKNHLKMAAWSRNM
jgi:hypothetical protein